MNIINKYSTMLSLIVLLSVSITITMDQDEKTVSKEAAILKIKKAFGLRKIEFDKLKETVETQIQVLKQLGAEFSTIERYEGILENREKLEQERKKREGSRTERRRAEKEKQFKKIKSTLVGFINRENNAVEIIENNIAKITNLDREKQAWYQQNIIAAVKAGMGFKNLTEGSKKYYSSINTIELTKKQSEEIELIFSKHEEKVTTSKSKYIGVLLQMLRGMLQKSLDDLHKKIDLAEKAKEAKKPVDVDTKIAKDVIYYTKYVNTIMNTAYRAETKKGDFFIKKIQEDPSYWFTFYSEINTETAGKVVKTMTDIITEIQKSDKVGLVGNEQLSILVDQISEQKKEFITKYNKYMEENIPTN